MPVEIAAIPLECAGVGLEPLAEAHREGLRVVAQAPAIWAHMPSPALDDAFDGWFDGALAISRTAGEKTWAVRMLSDGALVGSTRYLNIVAEHRRVEIGHTWYAPAVWATHVNPACKLALLDYGFETLGLNRVELKTDNRNLRSQAAIAKLGAMREGVFRSHMVRADGSLRDTVYFAIVRDEWPVVRDRLKARLAAFTPAKEPI
jgi:RimJ/RimL family protein N-acetyltransferase